MDYRKQALRDAFGLGPSTLSRTGGRRAPAAAPEAPAAPQATAGCEAALTAAAKPAVAPKRCRRCGTREGMYTTLGGNVCDDCV